MSRIKKASLPEMAYRVNQAFTVRRMANRVRARKPVVHVPMPDEIKLSHLQMPSFFIEVDEAIVKGILGGKVFTLNGERDALDQFNARWSRTYFASIRSAQESPDIRMVWESGRLQHLTILMAYACLKSQSPNIDALKLFTGEALLTWIRQNPFLSGPHYMSPMECGLRIPVFFYALKILDNITMEERREILKALYLHAWWLSRNLSLYSSLGNHTICECVGLVFAGAVFREFEEGKRWLDSGMCLLKRESQRQILADGGPIEQSFSYHRFVLDLFWLTVDFTESSGLHNCSMLKHKLRSGEAFLSSFSYDRGRVILAIGDSDDGYAVAPGVFPKRELREPAREQFRTFAESGYTVIRTVKGCCLTFDHGPLGMPPLYNHGHADSLSITLSVNGILFLVDSGTYGYNGVSKFRKYFKGTQAHNTVTIDDQDQANQETGFIWSHPYTTRIVGNKSPYESVFLIEAEHNGYTRLAQPVVHWRAVVQINDSAFIVHDRFHGHGFHKYELNWHLHPDTKVKKKDGWWQIEHSDIVLFIKLMDGDNSDLLQGEINPIKGWYSPQYGVRQTCSVLTQTVKGEPAESEFISVICAGQRTDAEQIAAALCRARLAANNCKGGKE